MEGVNEANILTDPVTSAACPKCGAMLEVAGLAPFTPVQCPACEFEFQVPSRFGNFMLLQLLGAGGMGGVYRARDEGLNREVAIKVMLKSLGDDPQFVETFQREAQAAAKLNHSHIAQIYSFGQEKGQPYIAMELVSGGSLDKMMSIQGPMDPATVIHIGAQVAEGLREAAEAGLVHGDVKPENILFDDDKNAKLVDFGLSAMASGPGNDVWGTPYYIAPEKVRRQKSDFRSDIYSLGGTLYHAIAGVPPFEGEDATAVVKARFDGPPKPMSEIRGKVPEEVERMIARMLEVEPQTRYPTYGSLLGDMRRYLAVAGPIQLGVSSKKIMIKNKHAGATTGNMNTTGAVGELPPGMVPVSQVEETPEDEEVARKRSLKKMAMIGGGAVVLALLVAGGIFGGMKYSKAQKSKAEAALAEVAKGKAKASIAKSVANAKTVVERLRTSVPEAMGYAKEAADVAVAVLGEGARASMVPPEPEYEMPQPAAAEVPADANAAAVASASNKVAVASNEVASASNKVAVASSAAPVKVEAPVVAAAPEEPAPAPGDAHPVVALVRGMYEEAYAVKKASLLADAQLAQMEEQAKAAEGLLRPEQSRDLIKLANGLIDKGSVLKYTKEIGEVPRKMSHLKKSLANIKADVVSLVETKRKEALEQEKKLKADEAAEKKRLEQEAYKEKVKGEVEKVTAAELANVSTLKQLQFRETIRVIKELADELTTPEAKSAAALALERINRVKDFQNYLIEKVPGFKSARGWAIDSADQKNLSVGGKKILWTEVYASHLEIVAELINGLVMDEKTTKEMRLREKTRLMANASLCLALFYKEIPSAQERAKKLATDAAQQFDVDADSIKQLMPEFFQ
jgi:hypothetical protein